MAGFQPQVSVLMPVFNAKGTVVNAVMSILNQEMGDFELIIVDDGSRDGSLALLLDMESQDTRIKVVQSPHRGITAALNLGLSHVAEAAGLSRNRGAS